MSNRAWMPLHIDDYIRDTDHLSATEHGAYLLLIMKYWRDGGLPSDDGLIRRYAKLSPEQWEESRDVLAALFESGWRHKRIDAELQKASEIIEKRRFAGKSKQVKSTCSADAEQKPSISTIPVTSNQLSDASASDAASPVDPRDALWTQGVQILVAISGKTQSSARSLIGKWLKQTRDDCALVMSKIQAAQRDRIGEPVSWINAALAPPPKPKSIGQMFIDDAIEMGLINEPSSPAPRRVEAGNGSREGGGTGIARRFTVPANLLGRIE